MVWSDGLMPNTPAHRIASDANARLRVVAGPGTGKSFAMKRRVARLLEAGVAPELILPVTFTRVAAQDLHRELVNMNVPGCEALNASTLHALAYRILMRNHVLAATQRVPRPLNVFETDAMTADLVDAHDGKKEVRKLIQAYDAAWARLNHQVPGYAPTPKDAAFQADLLSWLVFHEAMLIGEVIPELFRYLSANPLAAERSEFSHILVDEYQDLNKAEQRIIELLSNVAHVTIVGDDDQSIYSFKHAHPDGIRDWLVANAGAADVNLVDCQRCPTTVVQMANALIGHNQLRPVPRPLNPLPAKGAGDVHILQFPSLDAEVAGVVARIQARIAAGTPAGDILVLAQSRAVGTPLFDALQAVGVAVRSEYTESELQAEAAQYAFSLLKLLADRNDRVALRWLLGCTSATFNAGGYRRLRNHCEASGQSPWEALEELSAGIRAIPHTRALVTSFNTLVASIQALAAKPNLGEVIDTLFPAAQLETRQLRTLATTLLASHPAMQIDELVSELVTAITQPETPTNVDYVRIMSLHKSKGLSAPVTIVTGCVNGLLPRMPKAGLTHRERLEHNEEQRRLFYVGITRVKADPANGKPGTLILTYAQTMPQASALNAGITAAYAQGGTAVLQASPYIAEMAPHAPAAVAGIVR